MHWLTSTLHIFRSKPSVKFKWYVTEGSINNRYYQFKSVKIQNTANSVGKFKNKITIKGKGIIFYVPRFIIRVHILADI